MRSLIPVGPGGLTAGYEIDQRVRLITKLPQGASGPALISALGRTGRLQLAFGALLTVGLAVRF